MTWWETEHWKAYERAYGDEPGTRTKELAGATWLTHVVDLTPSEEELWRKIPKTMRQAIRKGPTEHIDFYGPLYGGRKFEELHIQANGGSAPRPTETYELNRLWLEKGYALLAMVPRVAACLVIRYDVFAYYASGPSLQPHVMPALIWAAMKECKRLGDRWFEVGWLKGDTEKERSIAKFKARWGGENKPANWLAMESQ